MFSQGFLFVYNGERIVVSKRRAVFSLVLFLLAIGFGFVSGCESLISPVSDASGGRLRIEFYDVVTGEPIKGLSISLWIEVAPHSRISVSGDSAGEGYALIELPPNITLSKASWVTYINIPGVWILQKTVGEKEVGIADGAWYIMAVGQSTSYSFRFTIQTPVNFLQQYDDSGPLFSLELYLTRGRVVTIYNPLDNIGVYDSHLSVSTISQNFFEVIGGRQTLWVLPDSQPLSLVLSVRFETETYGPLRFSSPGGEFNISVEIGNRTYIDLAVPAVQGLSSVQTGVLKGMLDAMASYGFKLDELYMKLGKASSLYAESVEDFGNLDRVNGTANMAFAIRLCRELYNEVIGAYNASIIWSPILLVVLVFFSLALSRMIAEKGRRPNMVFLGLFVLLFCFFLFSQPNFRLYFVFVFLLLTQRLNVPFSTTLISQTLEVLAIQVFIIVVLFTALRDFMRQTFGVSMRNLKRRRIKTILALTTIALVSAAAMSLLTFTPETTRRYQLPNRISKVNDVLVIYKRFSTSSETAYREVNEPFRLDEVKNFQSGNWTKSMNIFGVISVSLRMADGSTMGRFNLVAVNPQYMEEYVNVAESMGSDWSLNSTDRGMIIIGSEIASQYNLTAGSQVFLDNKGFTVKSVFNEQNAVENLRDIDGEYFFSLPSSTGPIFDSSTKQITGGSFIIGSTNDLAPSALSIYKVSLVIKAEHAEEIWDIAEGFLPYVFDYLTGTGGTSSVRTYEIHLTSQGNVFAISSGMPVFAITGNWQSHIIPLATTSLLLFTNSLGTVYERKSEIRIISAAGASPTRIRLIFLLEGTTLGTIGGILGYVVGYGISQVAGYALPALVQQNLLTGSPFTISFLAALGSSLLGCLLPSKASIKTVVPSGKLTKKASEIINVKKTLNEAYLEIPMKLQPADTRPFNDFLENLTKSYSHGTLRQLIMRNLTLEQSPYVNDKLASIEEKRWILLVNFASDFQVSITSRPNEDLKVLITPYSTRKKVRWTGRDYQNLENMAPILRKELMGYLSYTPTA